MEPAQIVAVHGEHVEDAELHLFGSGVWVLFASKRGLSRN